MYGPQGLCNYQVAVNRDGQQVYHRGNAKQGATECVQLASYRKHIQVFEQISSSKTHDQKQTWRLPCILIKRRITHLSKHPFLVEAVDEEYGGLCECHEEVTDRQVYDEVVWQATKLLVTTYIHIHINRKRNQLMFNGYCTQSFPLVSLAAY